MQIRRGYRGGNEVKHNIFDSISSNTVSGKGEKEKSINVALSKIATILSKGRRNCDAG